MRRTEAAKLDTTDWYRALRLLNLAVGQVAVRWGKASKGSPPRRAPSTPSCLGFVDVVNDYLDHIRPRYGFPQRNAMWLSERGGRVSTRDIEQRFADYRTAHGFEVTPTPHCLRHSHVTHQIEDGVDPKFVQEQVGHRFASTTAVYTGVSGDFMNTMMRISAPDSIRQFGGAGTVSAPKLDYTWNLRELMAQRGMYQTTHLRPKLSERGIELSESQVYRLVVDKPERISIKTLLALMDILGCGMEDLLQPIATTTRTTARAAGQHSGQDTGVGAFRPKRARITEKNQ